MTTSEAVRYINAWLSRNGYSGIFKQDVSLILSDNRRVSRSANVIKYSRIPFVKDDRGRVTYKLEDLQTLCNDILKPICSLKLAIKLAKAAGLKYYTEA